MATIIVAIQYTAYLEEASFPNIISLVLLQTISAFGMIISLVSVSITSNYTVALFLMVSAIGASAFGTGSLPVNIQDIAPNQAGAVYGEFPSYSHTYIVYK